MTARQYLEQARGITIKLGVMADQLEFLRTAAAYVIPQPSHVPKAPSPNPRKTEDAVIRIVEFEERIKAEYGKLAEINAVIGSVSDPMAQSLIVKRYIKGLPWSRIADELFISLRTVHRLHDAALAEVEKLAQLGTQ